MIGIDTWYRYLH